MHVEGHLACPACWSNVALHESLLLPPPPQTLPLPMSLTSDHLVLQGGDSSREGGC